MKFINTTGVCLFLALTASSLAHAQKLNFRNYTLKEGLPQNTVSCITQDQDGYLWLGTQVGVARFDGVNFQNFGVAQGLPDNNVNQILVDSSGIIWIATKGGVARYSHEEFKTFDTRNGLPDNTVYKLCADGQNRVWCITNSGVSVLGHDSVLFNLTENDGLPSNAVSTLFCDSKKRMWMGTINGAACYTEGSIKSITTELTYHFLGKQERTVRDIEEDSHGNIWIATQGGGIFVFRDYTLTQKYTRLNGLGNDVVLSLFRDHLGNMWCSQFQNGFSCYDGKKFINYGQSLANGDAIIKIIEDRRGQIWAQTFQTGVIVGKPGTFRKIGTENNLVDNQVQNLFLDSFGDVWIGTLGGVSMYGKGIFEIYTTAEGLPDNNILSVSCLSDNSVMAGTYFNLSQLKDQRVDKVFSTKDYSDSVKTILSLFRDNADNLWIGSYASLLSYNGHRFKRVSLKGRNHDLYAGDNGIFGISAATGDSLWISTEKGAFVFDKKTERYHRDSGLEPIEVRSTYKTTDNKVWFATVSGVYVKTSKGTLHFGKEEGLNSLVCTGIASNNKGLVWVGTEGGLARFTYTNETVKIDSIYTIRRGLASNTIYSLLYDGKDNLWIGLEKGLNRLQLSTGKIFFYGIQDGFIPLENNRNSISMDSKGRIWFGTVSGLVVYDPANDIISQEPPKTYITRLSFADTTIRIQKYCDSIDTKTGLPIQLKLPYNYNTFTIEFVGIHFTIPEKVRYKFILENYDDKPSELTVLSNVTYKKLPSGHYVFKVWASNNDGKWIENPVSFSFQVKPPFYKTVWAYLIYFIIVALILFGYVNYRERKLQHDKKVLEDEVRKRTAEIERQKAEIVQINVELREQQQEILAQRDEIERQRDIATQQRDQIGLQKKEITDSIHYAKRIQNAILPNVELIRQVLPEHFILFKPRDIVSGDFYWMTRKGEKIVLVAADCTGHGVPGAFMSMLGVSLLNEIVNKEDIFNAAEILNKLRENVKTTLSQTGKENEAKDGMDIALVVIDFSTGILQYAGANNPFYLVRRGELLEYKADGMPIGIYVGEEKSFTNNEIKLEPGDNGYIFSDGFPDQFGGPTGGKFKTKPFKRLIVQESEKAMSDQKLAIDKALEDWKGSLDQVDDILVIGFRI